MITVIFYKRMPCSHSQRGRRGT